MTEKIALIGGTGLYSLGAVKDLSNVRVKTEYGEVSMLKGKVKEKELYFLTRHGAGHHIPPHLVNYQANMAALKALGIHHVLATAAVGSLRRELPPGSAVVLDQFIDFTSGRRSTFYTGHDLPVFHIDFTEPYCPRLRSLLIAEAARLNMEPVGRGTYVCTNGPRFETPAEVRMFAHLGGDVVGMTNLPEVVMAREAGLCYATIALVSNYAAGISSGKLTHEEVLEMVAGIKDKLDELLLACVLNAPLVRDCRCSESGRHFKLREQVLIEED